MIKRTVEHPILVVNADLLTRLSFQGLIDYHVSNGQDMTVAVKAYDYQVPYGVTNMDEDYSIINIDEKPKHRFLVNAGIYVLSPKCLKMIKKNQYLDMTTLIGQLCSNGDNVKAYPIREYWLDIGLRQVFDKARTDYGTYF